MEWVHCHIARKPAPPKCSLEEIPPQLAAIVMKLLAKTPEERYQTAAGVEHDLRRCLDDWESRGAIAEFPLGERDHSDRLMIPEKLYGRDREIETLLAAFDAAVASAKPQLVLVSGYSGIGKSSVVSELHRALVPPRGLFASGKFDQLKRDVPYATLAQAFQGLIRQLLAKPEAELTEWREQLRQALNPNGALVIDLIPELKFMIGEQPRGSRRSASGREGALPDDSSPVDRCVRARRASAGVVPRRSAVARWGDARSVGEHPGRARAAAPAPRRRVPGQRGRRGASADAEALGDPRERCDRAGSRAGAARA